MKNIKKILIGDVYDVLAGNRNFITQQMFTNRHPDMEVDYDTLEIRINKSFSLKLTEGGDMTTVEKYNQVKDIIPIHLMGTNNPRTDERQTLYGDVLDWLRDNGYGKDHDLAAMLIGNHAIRHGWDGKNK